MKKLVSLLVALMLCMTSLPALAASYSSQINSIHSSFISGNISANSAPQQQVNGYYRCVELLETIAFALDT